MLYMLLRLVLVVAAVWFGLKLWRKWQQQSGLNPPRRDPEQFEPTVRCQRCGVHLPASAVSASGMCGKCSD